MSSLGDLLLGRARDRTPSPKDQNDEEEHRPGYDRNENLMPQNDNGSPQAPKVFPERIVKNEVEPDCRSNASSTDDYVRELLDPNDRPKNVWHVVEGPKVLPENEQKNPEDIKKTPIDKYDQQTKSTSDSYEVDTKRIDVKRERDVEAYNNISPIDQQRQQPLAQTSATSKHDDDDDDLKLESNRDRSRDRSAERSDRHRSREGSPSSRRHHRDRHSDRDRRRDRDCGNDRDRHRSDKHRSRHRYDSGDEDYDSYSRGSRRRHGRRSSRSRTRSPSSRTSSKRRERSKSDSQSPVTRRNSRTVLVMQLSPKVVSRDLEDFFSDVGRVREVRLIMDSKTRRHKGIAYIEFEDASSATKALAIHGQKFMGASLIIQSALVDRHSRGDHQSSTSYHTSNYPSSHASSRSNLPPNSYRVYVGALHVALTEDMLRSIFEPFGPITRLELMKDRTTGVSRGYAFITYANIEDGQEAVRCLDGFELAGKNLRVSKSTDKSEH